MTTREVAEKIIRESVCNHGSGAECSEYHEQDIINRIDEALRSRDERAVQIIDEHQALDKCEDNCWATIKAAIRERKVICNE